MKILLIEDEPKLVSIIQRDLTAEGHEISVALDGTTGLDMAMKMDFQLIILDIMLPGINGIEVCRRLRQANQNAAILMLTALGTTENVVVGLDSGADDYMVKPFSLAELNARIRTLARRNSNLTQPANVIQIADLVINGDEKSVKRGGKTIDLTATEYRLLEFLAKNKNHMLSRIEILEHVWNIDFNMGTNVVDVYINYLRKKVDKDFEPKLIHTVIGMGYILKNNAA
ncbi:response regulator transcription factor [Mucilaginibacter rubeus]|uniref:Response regulator transcription factor n=2 Tax=Mucilaginibacter TaxID=423349 RepID=A0AAE6JM22_9SPHI|nr:MULTISPECIES: response regulator transcription factor [Mucilaginibacter]QEM08020.1 response regulator transcription factor [Mucilaginibacter rubeus]QEM20471.1 response regulator transcription factor [Mucilaginibacter gossypii]QTE42804.1 response regulator transcription factor [Mucilaginibacter rubeus]QTE49405.1 response regulator transcription factor [Mucilaginibacter rubeus]QTE54501.1 response regulator transcription factor [Mucilaginibacter rubeus]